MKGWVPTDRDCLTGTDGTGAGISLMATLFPLTRTPAEHVQRWSQHLWNTRCCRGSRGWPPSSCEGLNASTVLSPCAYIFSPALTEELKKQSKDLPWAGDCPDGPGSQQVVGEGL